ncbi:unnamed protein product [Oikopleura dioica]|uniref:G-protein coupled receptors family 1 profile domain-containing protein n=1 Tax=Oikopleura dioica TaxID=34765 RepID=E4XBS3_OIKDI|nr:unnamed protein product [Oikopleura dioica]
MARLTIILMLAPLAVIANLPCTKKMCAICRNHHTKNKGIFLPACAQLYYRGCCVAFANQHGLTESTNLIMPSLNQENILPERPSNSWNTIVLIGFAFIAIVICIFQLESVIKKIVTNPWSLPQACEPLHTKNGHEPHFLSRQCGKAEDVFSRRRLSNVRGREKSDNSLERKIAREMKYELLISWHVPSTRPKPVIAAELAVYFFVFCTGIILNISVLQVVKTLRTRSVSSVFIRHLAIADLLQCVFGLFPIILGDFMRIVGPDSWIIPKAACLLVAFLSQTSKSTSFFVTSIISLDRMIIIRKPFGKR